MTNRRYRQYKWLVRLTILMAAMPLFQLSQCSTLTRQINANVANAAPATLYSSIEGLFLAPINLLLALI